MEVIRALKDFYDNAVKEVEYISTKRIWEKADYNFDEDPPCIKAILDKGVFAMGTINMTQMRLAAYLKTRGIAINEAVIILDEWLTNVPSEFIYEQRNGQVDYTRLQEQNRFVCKTVFTSAQYGFSCSGIKQIPGIDLLCTNQCRDQVKEKITVSLFDASKSQYRGKRLNIIVEVIGRQDAVMIIPKTITVSCTGQRFNTKRCSGCPFENQGGDNIEFEVGASSPYILKWLEPSQRESVSKITSLIGMTGIDCKAIKWSVTEQNAETIHIVPPIANEYSDSDRHTRQLAYFIGHGLKTNQKYILSGYTHVNERTSNAVLVFDKSEESEDSLLEFEQTDAMKEASKVFSIETGGDVMKKYKEVIASLSFNHIRVWGRDPMIMAMDLTYHSVRRFYFQEKLIKGWMNVLVIGDSGQAKTETAISLMKHYDMGYKASAEASTRAGLLFGVDVKSAGPNHLIWGAIPRYSGRIVVVDELKQLIKTGAFAQLTDARSSGVVSVDTIVHGRALAETRLILLTNPVEKRRMGSYYHPVEAIADLIPDLEDIRRFDIVVGVASKEIDDEVYHQNIRDMEKIEDIYTHEVCKNHLLWIWNLQPEDVIISNKVEDSVLKISLEMCKLYSPVIPVVEPADQREKVARVSVALAARLNSVTDDNKLLVTEKHVKAAFDFMRTIYDSEALKYDAFSDANALLTMDSGIIDNLSKQFRNSDWSPHWRNGVQYIAEEAYIVSRIMAAAINCPISSATKMLDWLTSHKLLKLTRSSSYIKTSNGVTFIKAMMAIVNHKRHGGMVKAEDKDDIREEF